VGGLAVFVYFTYTMAIVPLNAAAQTKAEAIKWLCLLLKLFCIVCVIGENLPTLQTPIIGQMLQECKKNLRKAVSHQGLLPK